MDFTETRQLKGKIYEYICEIGSAPSSEIAQALDVPIFHARRLIKALQGEGKIVSDGVFTNELGEKEFAYKKSDVGNRWARKGKERGLED